MANLGMAIGGFGKAIQIYQSYAKVWPNFTVSLIIAFLHLLSVENYLKLAI